MQSCRYMYNACIIIAIFVEDDGSVVVVPQSYTGFQATATDDTATNNRAIGPTACFEELPPMNICAQATDTTHFQRNLIVPPAFSTFSEGVVTITVLLT